MMPLVDLRSDTITHPTEAMREAMRAAPVGDDVYGEDPTVNRLEEMAAARLGKEAALFVPSGTMANLAAVMTHAQPGDEAIVEDQGHIYRVEGSMVAIAGVIPRLVPGERGVITAARLESALANSRQVPGLLCLENTHNLAGGTVITPQQTAEVCAVAHGGGMRQAGVIAAAGIVALETMVDRLAEDHHHARVLAQQLAEIPGLRIDLATGQTNLGI